MAKKKAKAVGNVQLLDLQEFADALSMSREWARKLVQGRKIMFVRVGRSVRIPAAELDRIVAHGLVPPGKVTA
jgi:excisionase family DNA binding protein